jgi:hypothetical protein
LGVHTLPLVPLDPLEVVVLVVPLELEEATVPLEALAVLAAVELALVPEELLVAEAEEVPVVLVVPVVEEAPVVPVVERPVDEEPPNVAEVVDVPLALVVLPLAEEVVLAVEAVLPVELEEEVVVLVTDEGAVQAPASQVWPAAQATQAPPLCPQALGLSTLQRSDLSQQPSQLLGPHLGAQPASRNSGISGRVSRRRDTGTSGAWPFWQIHPGRRNRCGPGAAYGSGERSSRSSSCRVRSTHPRFSTGSVQVRPSRATAGVHCTR